jgi:hypothetical protein
MTEKFAESHESPVYELLNTEERAEEYMHNVLLQGGQLAYRTFKTATEANEAGDEYVEACNRIAKSISGIGKVDMTAQGGGVLVTNVTSSADNRTGIVSFQTNPAEPLVPLSMFDVRTFHYQAVISGVIETDKNTWKVQPCIVGSDIDKGEWNINAGKFGFPLSKIVIESMMIIPCANDDVQIEIKQLVHQRQCAQALEELVRQDVECIGLADDVNRIHEAFSEDAETIAQFPEVALLRQIGKKGIQFGARSDKQADILNTALARGIGVDRPLIIDGRIYQTDDDNNIVMRHTSGFNGKVVDVISQLPKTGENIGPTLVMMPVDDQEMRYIPFTSITAVKF